ncbi:MAG: Hsp20/alpha crystallin family protein [bacterium]|nr:Hsp20/alpha crystallin family protein [bacterium]
MTKVKKSFLEILTGARKIDEEEENSAPIYSEEETEMVINNKSNMAPQQEPSRNSWNNSLGSTPSNDVEGQLTIDVYQTETEIVIKSTIAGVKPEDLDVAINNDMVTIRGERKNEELVNSENYYYQECYWGSFSRSVVLPVDIVAEKIEASLKNGILTIRLPKADINKTKRIQVRGF